MRRVYQLCKNCIRNNNQTMVLRFWLRTIRARPQKVISDSDVYNQRAINPSKFTQKVIIDGLTNENRLNDIKQILHPLYLYESKIVSFDYDYYVWACSVLIPQQKNIQIGDILTIMRLGREYQIQHQLFWHHFQNQLLWRFKQTFGKQVQRQYEKLQQKIEKTYEQFENLSQDNFQILTAQEIQRQKQFQQNQQNKQSQQVIKGKDDENSQMFLKKVIKKLISSNKRKNAKVSMDQLFEFSDLLVWHGCKNFNLLLEMIEFMTLKLKQLSPRHLLGYMKLLTHICTAYMSQYTQKPNQLTPRTIKNIYKLQSFYYEAMTPVLVQRFEELEQVLFMDLTKQLTIFPIKKRKFRNLLLPKIINRMQTMQTQPKIIDQYTKSICRKDKKMFQCFRKVAQQVTQKVSMIQQS